MEKYQKIQAIGEGGYGVVLKCKCVKSGKLVAIKRFKDPLTDQHTQNTVNREIKALLALKHVNIIRLVDEFQHRDRLHMVFEYADRSLLDEIQRHPQGMGDNDQPGLVKMYMWQLLQALKYMHGMNYVHRDIKPENVLITKDGLVKLCDFGFARTKLQADGVDRMTEYVATRWYRAPELLTGSSTYNESVDIWAVALLIPECVTGNPMFPGRSDVDQIKMVQDMLGPFPRNLIEQFQLVYSHQQQQNANKFPFTKRSSTDLRATYINILRESTLRFISKCLQYTPALRPSAASLLKQQYFTENGWSIQYQQQYNLKVANQGLNDITISKEAVKANKFATFAMPSKLKKRLPGLNIFKTAALVDTQEQV
ncbi:hypothetical protein MP228_003813 [Amoeboaphelidium protococcarum]|nr:hypothetical protein MP228_003813 [Amoeboaphelidium protococcarum]